MHSVVIPVYNEEGNIFPLYNSLKPVMEKLGEYEILFIDDGSDDGTFKKIKGLSAKNERVRCIRFRKNFGQTSALSAGFDHARGDLIITMDGDLQNNPLDIPRLLDKMEEGYDVVSGWRYKRRDSIGKKIFSKISNWLARRLTGVKLHDFGCTLKVYKKDAIKDIELYGEMHRYIPAIVKWHGYSIAEIKVRHSERNIGKSKYGMSRLMKGIFDLMNFKFWSDFSTRPLHFFGGMGLFSFIAGIIIGLYLVILKFFFGEELSNRPLLLLTVLLMIFGMQLLMFGFLAEMMTRNYFVASKKKNYEIEEIVG